MKTPEQITLFTPPSMAGYVEYLASLFAVHIEIEFKRLANIGREACA